jgi:alginate O-acetyltransferase complex protein AlgI
VLFNSYEFIFVFLPVTLAVFYAFLRLGMGRGAIGWLLLASLAFYSYWQPAHLPVLAFSILFNYAAGLVLQNRRRRGRGTRLALAFAVAANLALLVWFKYTAFFVNEAASLAGQDFVMRAVLLPLGISFFTFQQIAYVVDSATGKVERSDFVEYALFVSYFPQLIAGPIVHHAEVLHQFRTVQFRVSAQNFARGLSFFTIGLFKKVVLADNLAKFADPLFLDAQAWANASAAEAWTGVLAYTFQLYFDFSGYSDMAIGLGLLCGIRIPVNFNSPYKALNIIDFWRRWHITLSHFLRDYLYVALGGNRQGKARRYVNLMLTMLLGGFWHGANWTFLVWGGLHGLYLVVNHAWNALAERIGLADRGDSIVWRWFARGLTLIAVMIGWVFFRAPSLEAAGEIVAGMFGANGIGQAGPALLGVAAFLPVVWLLPNTQQFVDGLTRSDLLRWRPSVLHAAVLAGCFVLTVSQMSKVSVFIYFQF